MRKMEAYRRLQDLGYGFIANVVLVRHRNPARKLKGLLTLIEEGHTVRLGSFDIDCLVVDGHQRDWNTLGATK